MLKKIVFTLTLASCIFTASNAREPSAPTEQPADTTKHTVEAVNIHSELDTIRVHSPLNKRIFFAIGISDIGAAPESPNYAFYRSIAFGAAEMQAKQKLATILHSRIDSSLKNSNLFSHDGLLPEALDGDAELTDMINKAIQKELQDQGIDLNDREAVKKAMPRITATRSFKKRIEVVSQIFLLGIAVHASCASQDKVGVLCYSSKTLREIAIAMNHGKFKKYPPGQDVFAMVEKLSPEQLLNTYGLRVMIDKNGDPCLVAFAQMPVFNDEDSAREMADIAATALIGDFAGGFMRIRNTADFTITIADLQDGNSTDSKKLDNVFMPPNVEYRAEFSAENTKLSGFTECKSGILRLPSGQKIAYIVKFWTPAAAYATAEVYTETERLKENIEKQK